MIVKKLKDGVTRVVVYPDSFSRPLFARLDKAEEMRQWCTETLGKGGSNLKKYKWRYGWIHDDVRFYFKKEEDATLFVLRWS